MSDLTAPSAHTTVRRRARRAHTCHVCLDPIDVGEFYIYVSGLWDGRWADFRRCLFCDAFLDELPPWERENTDLDDVVGCLCDFFDEALVLSFFPRVAKARFEHAVRVWEEKAACFADAYPNAARVYRAHADVARSRLVALERSLPIEHVLETAQLHGIPEGMALAPGDPVLVTGNRDPRDNGVWCVREGAWTRP